MSTTEFIAAIELSSSRITGIAGQKQDDGSIQVQAYACEDSSAFVRKGQVYNIDKAAHAIQAIVAGLEEQLGQSIAKVYAGISGQSLRSMENRVSRTLDEEEIISADLIDQLCDENRELPMADLCVLDVAPQEYKIDNTLYADPVGVAGRHITARFLNLVARHQLRKNLEQAFEKANVKIADLPVAPLALARSVLTENEMRAGCALVDLGANTTTVQVYKNNLLRYLCVLPLGSANITHDLTCLKIEESEAENLKLCHGSALYQDEDEDAPTQCLLNDGRSIKLRELNEIVGARAEEILSNAWNQIQLSGYDNELFAGVILTGGGSNLPETETLFRSVSRTDKVRTARFVQETVSGHEEDLTHDGRQNTLLGLLAAGHDNCAQPPQSKVTNEPQQGELGLEVENAQQTAGNPETAAHTPGSTQSEPKDNTEKDSKSRGGKGGKSGGKDTHADSGSKKGGFFSDLFGRLRDGILEEDNSDPMSARN